ncbi:MAG TPA: MFS transporter [Solirubrobacteraceae bacterium]|nr:MFS transporter [Solirubrobacteraceae bacterium]
MQGKFDESAPDLASDSGTPGAATTAAATTAAATTAAATTDTDAGAASVEDSFLSGRHAAIALAGLAASASCFLTAENLPIGLLPQISSSMHTSLSTTGLLVTIYALLVVTASIPLARATRRIPRRYLLAAVAAGLAIGSLGSAVAPNFGTLIASRIFTATAQAIFWATGPLEAASLVRPERRSRALTAVFGGSAAGQVLGLPIGTAIGHAAGWRVAFVSLAVAAVVLLATILVALPTRVPRPPHADAEGTSDRTRYRALIVFTALAVTADFAMFTYAAAFLVKVSGLPKNSVAVVLFAAGLVSTLGLFNGASLYLRHRRAAIPVAFSFMLLSLLALFAVAKMTVLAAVFIALVGLFMSVFTVAGMTAVIELKPSNGSAWYSTFYNVGIGSGPLAGGFALQEWGLRSTPLAGAAIGAVALAVLVGTDLHLRRHRH